jgi:hypothetical protein
MHLVQVLLPLRDSQGHLYPDATFAALRQALVRKYGGLTAYSRAPAKGKWVTDGVEETDDIIIFEVMVEELDRKWWGPIRAGLESDLNQQEIVIRCMPMERL